MVQNICEIICLAILEISFLRQLSWRYFLMITAGKIGLSLLSWDIPDNLLRIEVKMASYFYIKPRDSFSKMAFYPSCTRAIFTKCQLPGSHQLQIPELSPSCSCPFGGDLWVPITDLTSCPTAIAALSAQMPSARRKCPQYQSWKPEAAKHHHSQQ